MLKCMSTVQLYFVHRACSVKLTPDEAGFDSRKFRKWAYVAPTRKGNFQWNFVRTVRMLRPLENLRPIGEEFSRCLWSLKLEFKVHCLGTELVVFLKKLIKLIFRDVALKTCLTTIDNKRQAFYTITFQYVPWHFGSSSLKEICPHHTFQCK